jgi:hypothetical protein
MLLGLLGNDLEWHNALSDVSAWSTSSELRSLFTYLLIFCDMANPLGVWEKHWPKMGDDIAYEFNSSQSHAHLRLSEDDLKEHVLYRLELLLNANTSSYSLAQFGLPMPSQALLNTLQDRLLMEEKDYDRSVLAAQHDEMFKCLNTEQLGIYNVMTSVVAKTEQCLIFVYGHGGTGKTYLWTTLIYGLRSTGKVVLAVAASGIASLLLPSGRTAHSRFKIPIDITDQSLCHIKKNPTI